MRTISYLLCAITIYIYIYSPILKASPINLLHIVVFLFAFGYVIAKGLIKGYICLFKKELRLLFAIALFSLLISFIHNGLNFQKIALWDLSLAIEILLVPYALMIYFSRHLKCDLEKVIIVNAIVAGCISIALLLNPNWANIMKNQILVIPESLVENLAMRGYGFSGELTFGYPVVQAFCAGLIICGIIRKKTIFYYLSLIPLVISAIVNARSSIIVIGVAVFVLIISSPLQKLIKSIIPIILLLMAVIVFYNPRSNNQLTESIEWGMSFFDIMGDYMSGEEAENMDVLGWGGAMAQLPHSQEAWIYGEGVSVFSNRYMDYNPSDIGYTIRIVYGGIFYALLWIMLYFLMLNRLIKINKDLALLLFISIIFLNWKGDFYGLNVACRFFFTIYAFCIMDNNFLNYKRKLNTLKKK